MDVAAIHFPSERTFDEEIERYMRNYVHPRQRDHGRENMDYWVWPEMAVWVAEWFRQHPLLLPEER